MFVVGVTCRVASVLNLLVTRGYTALLMSCVGILTMVGRGSERNSNRKLVSFVRLSKHRSVRTGRAITSILGIVKLMQRT